MNPKVDIFLNYDYNLKKVLNKIILQLPISDINQIIPNFFITFALGKNKVTKSKHNGYKNF